MRERALARDGGVGHSRTGVDSGAPREGGLCGTGVSGDYRVADLRVPIKKPPRLFLGEGYVNAVRVVDLSTGATIEQHICEADSDTVPTEWFASVWSPYECVLAVVYLYEGASCVHPLNGTSGAVLRKCG